MTTSRTDARSDTASISVDGKGHRPHSAEPKLAPLGIEIQVWFISEHIVDVPLIEP